MSPPRCTSPLQLCPKLQPQPANAKHHTGEITPPSHGRGLHRGAEESLAEPGERGDSSCTPPAQAAEPQLPVGRSRGSCPPGCCRSPSPCPAPFGHCYSVPNRKLLFLFLTGDSPLALGSRSVWVQIRETEARSHKAVWTHPSRLWSSPVPLLRGWHIAPEPAAAAALPQTDVLRCIGAVGINYPPN